MALYSPEGRLLARGRVFAGQARRFEDVVSGTIQVETRPEPAGAATRHEVAIKAGQDGDTDWTYSAEGARLVVVNTTDEALELAIDGAPRGRVAARASLELVEAPGSRVLTARSIPSLRPYEEVLVLTRETQARWEVKGGQAKLAVDNRSGEALTVWVESPGAPRSEARELDAGARLELGEVATGVHRILAIGRRSTLQYAGLVQVGAGQAGTFVVGAMRGSIRVDNRTRAPLTVYVSEHDGQEREVGVVGAGQVVLVKDLARGPVSLRAIRAPSSLGRELLTPDSGAVATDLAATRVYASRQDLAETPAATWVIGERVGAVHIDNRREESIEVYADGMRLGEVPAGTNRTFTGVPAGARRIDTVGLKSGEAFGDTLALAEDGFVALKVEAITGHVEIENGTSEALVPRGILAAQAEAIAPGETRRFLVRSGTIAAALTGKETGYLYSKKLLAPAGGVTRWVASVTPGTLTVWSRLAESVALTVSDRAVGTLAPDESLVLNDLEPGPYRVQTVGLRSGRVKAYDVLVSPTSDGKLTLSVELGVVLIENRAKEAVEVSIGGALYGRVDGGRVHAFGSVPPGAREVTLDFPKSRRTQKVAIDLREGQRARVTALAPEGLIVVDNASGEALQIRVDDVIVARIAEATGSTFVNVPAGERHVRVERMSTRSEIGFTLEVPADQAIHLPVPPPHVRLVVVNRTDLALELFADDGALLTVAPRSSQMLDSLVAPTPRGEVRLVARDSSGHITHEERRRLRAGETSAWVLD